MASDAFYSHINTYVFGGKMTAEQSAGLHRIVDYGAEKFPGLGVDARAYVLATVTWESGRAMKPVEEAGYLPKWAQMAYLRRKLYFPWYGRGFPQVTWKANYEKFGIKNRTQLMRLCAEHEFRMQTEYGLKVR